MRIDLHLHSTASDGLLSPGELAVQARAAGLDLIALTDHDTAVGVAELRMAAAPLGLQVIPGLEVSSTRDGSEIHILGYFVDPRSPAILRHQSRAGSLREDRIRGMVERLAAEGLYVPYEAVLEAAGPDRGSVGRPHLARALVAAGHVASLEEAFDRYIGDQHPAFIPTRLLTPEEAVELVLEAGGVPVWAHPPMYLLDVLLPPLVEAGLRGLEVHRPRNGPDRVRRLQEVARSAGLLVTGGSDWHGPESGELGAFHLSVEQVADLLEEGGLTNFGR